MFVSSEGLPYTRFGRALERLDYEADRAGLLGHSSVNITLDRYRHLLPGSAAAALGLLNDFLSAELAAA